MDFEFRICDCSHPFIHGHFFEVGYENGMSVPIFSVEDGKLMLGKALVNGKLIPPKLQAHMLEMLKNSDIPDVSPSEEEFAEAEESEKNRKLPVVNRPRLVKRPRKKPMRISRPHKRVFCHQIKTIYFECQISLSR